MELCKEIIEIVETHGFTLHNVEEQDGEYYVEMGQFTPAGEDWWEIIWFNGTNKDFINGVTRRYNTFDVDEEAEMWVEIRGTRGVPSSIKVLIKDAEWKEEALLKLSDALDELEFEEECE